MGLTAKQQAFVAEYLQCWNATEAARRADYAHPNTQGPRLLVNVGIQQEIQKRVDERTMSADEVLVRLAEQARADYSQYITDDGHVDMESLVAAGKAHLIKGIKETQHGRNIEFYDGQKALELIGKSHRLFTERIEHEGDVNLNVEYVNDWRERSTDD